MAMGKRKTERQQDLFVPQDRLPRSPGHVFYRKLNALLAEAGFDRWVEELCQFWEQDSKPTARSHLQQWYQAMLASGVRLLQDLARFVMPHQDGLLAWYDHPLSTGPLAGTNRKIRTLQATHYGFRDHDNFVLRLYSLYRTRYALVG